MIKTTIEIIEELNDYTGKTLSISHYESLSKWEISSYGRPSLFSDSQTVWNKNFKEALIVAYKIMLEDKKKEGIK